MACPSGMDRSESGFHKGAEDKDAPPPRADAHTRTHPSPGGSGSGSECLELGCRAPLWTRPPSLHSPPAALTRPSGFISLSLFPSWEMVLPRGQPRGGGVWEFSAVRLESGLVRTRDVGVLVHEALQPLETLMGGRVPGVPCSGADSSAVAEGGGARDGEQGSRSRPRPPCAEGRCSRLTARLPPPHQLQVLSHSRLPALPLRRGRKNSLDAQLPLFLLPPSGRLTLRVWGQILGVG